MTSIKTEKVNLTRDFQIEIASGWFLDIDTESNPIKYTLLHGKKSMSFHSNVARDLCSRNYGLRLAKGRRQMVIPPHVLQAFVDHEIFISWYDPNICQQSTIPNMAHLNALPDHVTIGQSDSWI